MNVDSILLSEYATMTDGFMLTVVRSFNQMSAPTFPAMHRWMALSLLIHAHASERGTEHRLAIKLVDDRGGSNEIHQGSFRLKDVEPPPGMPIRHTYIHQMVSVQIPHPGAYAFEVFIDDTYHAATSFYVVHAPKPTEGEQPA